MAIHFASLIYGQDCIYVPICAQVNETPVIFVGRAVDRADYHYRFAVEEIFKGLRKGTREEIVDIALHGGLALGQRYLILAELLGDEPPYVMQCGGDAKHIERAQEDLKFLRKWATGQNVTRLQGRVAENVEDSMVSYELDVEHRPALSSVQITAIRNGRKYEATTDDKGYFQIPVPRAGDYTITAGLEGHVSTADEYEVSVEPNSCSEQDIGMWNASSVSGRVTDEQGKPVRGLPIDIQSSGEQWNRVSGSGITDDNGRYEIRRLPIGEYILGVNLGGMNSSVPYPPRFYPGVGRREEAEVIRARDRWGARRGGDDLSRFTNSSGKAVFHVLTDREFQIEADRLFWTQSARSVQPVSGRQKITLPAGKTAAVVQITVDKVNDIRDKDTPVDMSPYNKKP